MKHRFMKRAIAAALILTFVAATTPVQPMADILAVNVSAEAFNS